MSHQDNDQTSCSSDRCQKLECLKAVTYSCGKPQPKGVVLHNDHLYLNLVDGNMQDPALGVGAGTYAGAFDLYSLIQYVIANPST